MTTATRSKIVLLADSARPEVASVLNDIRLGLRDHVEIAAELPANNDALPATLEADFAVAVGGDGTLISQARRVVDRDIPLIGVNVGRLGFLAEFDVHTLREHAPIIFGPSPPIHEHMILDATVESASGEIRASGVAINDCVVTSGPPFRMIEIRLSIDSTEGPTLTGDGVIVATPVGSTAYNVSAGGPIVYPEVEATVITPLAAHSLAFRSIVVGAESDLVIEIVQANEGTTLIQDGQVATQVRAGDRILISRHDRKAQFVVNPHTTFWRIVQDKLRWAVPPTYRDGGR